MKKQITWRGLNANTKTMSESELEYLIKTEKGGMCRLTILVRAHQRLSALRTERERAELTKLALSKKL